MISGAMPPAAIVKLVVVAGPALVEQFDLDVRFIRMYSSITACWAATSPGFALSIHMAKRSVIFSAAVSAHRQEQEQDDTDPKPSVIHLLCLL